MKIKILQENLKQALNFVQKGLSPKPALPILSSIKIEAQKDFIYILSTDLNIGVKTKLKGEILDPGSITVQGDVFIKFINSLSIGEIELETLENNTLEIKSSSSTTKIPFKSDEDFPVFPSIEGKLFSLDIEDANKIENFVSFSVSKDVMRPVLTTISFVFNKDYLEVAGTDSFRLSVLDIRKNFELDSEQILISQKGFSEVVRIANVLKENEILFVPSKEDEQIKFIVGNTEFYIKMVFSNYPPYEKIIPDDFTFEYEVDPEEFFNHIKRAYIFSRGLSNVVKFVFTNENVKIVSKNSSMGEYEGVVPVKALKSQENITLAFIADYLMDFYTKVKPEKFFIKINESLKPVEFKTQDKDYLYIVMPFKLTE